MILVLASCKQGLKNENGIVFESEKLVGKYKVNVAELIYETTKAKKNDDAGTQLNKGLAKMMARNIEMEFNFYKNNKGLFIMDLGWFSAFVDSKNSKHEFTYKLEQDSVLIITTNDKEIQRIQLIVKKFSDNFDYIELINREDKSSFFMKKII